MWKQHDAAKAKSWERRNLLKKRFDGCVNHRRWKASQFVPKEVNQIPLAIGSANAWFGSSEAGRRQWLQISMGSRHIVTGFKLEGAKMTQIGPGVKWQTTSMSLAFSDDAVNWTPQAQDPQNMEIQ